MRRTPPKRSRSVQRAYSLPPQRSSRINRRHIPSAIVLMGLLVALFGIVPAPSVESPPATAAPPVVASAPAPTQTPIVAQPTAAVAPTATTASVPAPTPAAPAEVACSPECLIRLPGGSDTSAGLTALGVIPSYADDSVVWVTASSDLARSLDERFDPFDVLDTAVETLPLYIARIPSGGDPTAAMQIGDVLDYAGLALLVSVPGAPPYMLELADAGIALEKFPPSQSVNPGGLPQLADPWAPTGAVSAQEIESSISELQEIGAEDGLGTRYYASAGNVEAAEYLFKRLAAYGLIVRYEDFIGDNGRLTLNVVGQIPGRDASKILLLTAHFDSIASDTNDPTLAPGALDNASGVSALLETARVLSQYDLLNPIEFAFFNAEEVGLQGAAAFANLALAEDRPYAAALNVDSIGAYFETNRLIVNADADSAFIQDALVEINTVNVGFEIDVWPRQNPIIVADDTRLSQVGIPTILLACVVYGDPLINQSGDTIDQVDPFRIQRIVQLIVLTLDAL